MGTPNPAATLSKVTTDGCLAPDSSLERCATETPLAAETSSCVISRASLASRIRRPTPESKSCTLPAEAPPDLPKDSMSVVYPTDKKFANTK